MLEIDEKVAQMPQPQVIEVSPNSRIAFTSTESLPLALTISWQWVLSAIGEALIARDSRGVFKLLFWDLDYGKLNNNAVEDIRTLVRQPVDETALRAVQVKIDLIKELMREYLQNPQTNQRQLNYLLNESSFVVHYLKTLEVVGVGAFMIASGFRLALLQSKASSDLTEWSNVKNRAIEYSQYARGVTPNLFKLSVGLIDKECRCTSGEFGSNPSEQITEYECRYSDGKDIHLFREISPDAISECNKHRLRMFETVTDRVNQIAAKPVRSASKKWLELAASI